jgi:hypothetical protein
VQFCFITKKDQVSKTQHPLESTALVDWVAKANNMKGKWPSHYTECKGATKDRSHKYESFLYYIENLSLIPQSNLDTLQKQIVLNFAAKYPTPSGQPKWNNEDQIISKKP